MATNKEIFPAVLLDNANKRRKIGEESEGGEALVGSSSLQSQESSSPKNNLGREKTKSREEEYMSQLKAILKKPKKNITAYAFFIKEKKKEFCAGRSNNKIATVLMKEFGKEWSDLSEEKKEPYNKLALQDKQRYEKELKEFTRKCGSEKKLKELESKRPKKALSAYMIFVRETRAKVCEKYPGMHALEVMKKVGSIWQKLNAKEKKKFEDGAQLDKQRFQRELEIFKKELDSSNDSDKDSNYTDMPSSKAKDYVKTTNVQHSGRKMKKTASDSTNLKNNLVTVSHLDENKNCDIRRAYQINSKRENCDKNEGNKLSPSLSSCKRLLNSKGDADVLTDMQATTDQMHSPLNPSKNIKLSFPSTLKPLNEVVMDNRERTASILGSQDNEEVIRLASEEEPKSIPIYINDSTQIMNGVLDLDVDFDEVAESPLSFISQPRQKYHSKSDTHFDSYLDWIVGTSCCHTF